MSLRLGILTSNEVRHRYFVNALAQRLDVVAVGYQETRYAPADTAADQIDAETAKTVQHHFDERHRQELAYFGHDDRPREDGPACEVRYLDPTTLSSESTAAFLERGGVDVVLVYGASLIKPPLLDRFCGRMINMHLGLSPYYRGTATNFYPLLNDEPEYVGATIHMIDAGIDSGDIIHHARPEIVADDMPHTVGCKAILAGIEKVAQALQEFEAGILTTVPQWPVQNARLYRRKDFHPSQVVELYQRIAAGLFHDYVARRPRVENAFRLVA